MKKYALVIGVSRYEDPDITDLNFAAHDAEEIGEALREVCGFHDVRVLATGGEREPEHVNIVKALCSLAPDLTAADMFLFYFAGHGIVTETGAHLLASNSFVRMPELASVSWHTLGDCLSHIECSDRVLILDACRDDPNKGRGEQDNLLTAGFSRDIRAVANTAVEGVTPATCVLFSCKLGERAYEWPDKKHGAFTHYLLEGLRGAAADERGRITVDGLGRYVEAQVPRWAKKVGTRRQQTPWAEREGSLREIVLVAGATTSRRAQIIDEPSKDGSGLECKAESGSDWQPCAEARNEVSGNDSEAVRCLREAESKAELIDDCWNWMSCAKAWREIPDNGREAMRCLRKAEGTALTSKKWTACAKAWKELFGYDDEAQRCLKHAECDADEHGDWWDCAYAWKKLLDKDGEAMRCLREAESKAKYHQWRYCAKAWKELFDNDVEAKRCLEQAESEAGGHDDWAECAGTWKELFNDHNEAARCMKEAYKSDGIKD